MALLLASWVAPASLLLASLRALQHEAERTLGHSTHSSFCSTASLSNASKNRLFAVSLTATPQPALQPNISFSCRSSRLTWWLANDLGDVLGIFLHRAACWNLCMTLDRLSWRVNESVTRSGNSIAGSSTVTNTVESETNPGPSCRKGKCDGAFPWYGGGIGR